MTRAQPRADRHLLAEQYPLAFSASGGGRMKKPLSGDIAEDLIQRGIVDENGDYLPPCRIRAAVNRYMVGPKYTYALAQGGARIDLDGQPCGEVSERKRERALQKLKAMGWDGFFNEAGQALSQPRKREAA
jgi:ProP effector